MSVYTGKGYRRNQAPASNAPEPILVRLCKECHSGQSGVKKVTADAVRRMKTGDAFITLITGKNPNGEIRGQIKVV